ILKIHDRSSHMCGDVKRQAHHLTWLHYGFESSDVEADRTQTQALMVLLKDRSAFVYKDYETQTGLFENPILLKAIKSLWFYNVNADGVVFHLDYNLIPLATMALVFAVVS
ncbi:hypothetical protein K439DRAFT_1278591, partial [Ramaria rubella]